MILQDYPAHELRAFFYCAETGGAVEAGATVAVATVYMMKMQSVKVVAAGETSYSLDQAYRC